MNLEEFLGTITGKKEHFTLDLDSLWCVSSCLFNVKSINFHIRTSCKAIIFDNFLER